MQKAESQNNYAGWKETDKCVHLVWLYLYEISGKCQIIYNDRKQTNFAWGGREWEYVGKKDYKEH